MRIYILLLCVCYFLLAPNYTFFVSTSECPTVASTDGFFFIFGVPMKRIDSDNYIFVIITPLSNSTALVKIVSPYVNYIRQFTVTDSTIIGLNEIVVQVETGYQFKGIQVYSNISISVAVLAYNNYNSAEAFLVLPVSALATRYTAASYLPSVNSRNSILVVGVESNTSVSIQYKGWAEPGFFLETSITLDKFQTFQVVRDHDLSGAVIFSDKPVAVMTGSYHSQIPVGTGKENYLVEQLIPNMYWTFKFIVPPILLSSNYVVKIVVDKSNTTIHCYNSTNYVEVNLDLWSVYEAMFGSEPTVIEANNPISVFQYLADVKNISIVPYMSTVQGVSQFVSSYMFHVISLWGEVNATVAITVSRDSLNSLQLNDKNISTMNPVIVPVVKPMHDYITVFINVTGGRTYSLHHIKGETFGASLYYLNPTTKMAYGYPLQLSLTQAECKTEGSTTPSVTSIPSSHASKTQGSTTPTVTDIPSSHETTDINYMDRSRNGTWCMNCDNMLHLQYCDTATRCETDQEVCYIQTYARSDKIIAYKSGCMDRNKCRDHDGSMHCQHCCDGNFCNTVGCGDPGLPDLHSRGPMCFDCTHKGEEDICQALQMCELGQVCKVEKYKWGSGFHYTMGCVDKSDCSSKRSLDDFQSRNVVACSRCCDSDFCNSNCTINHTPSLIG